MAGPEQRACLATFRRGDLEVTSRHEFASEGDFPSSPIFVPRPGGVPGGGDGWIVVPVLNDDGARIECFDAADVGRGPVAVLAGPSRERLPFMLHSVWMADVATAPEVERLRVRDDIDPERVAALPDGAREAVDAVLASFD